MADPAVLTVTPNPTIDVGLTVEYLVPDHKLRAIDHRRDPGGGGVNVARVLQRFGVASQAWVAAGGPTGDELAAFLEQEGITPVVHRTGVATRENLAVTDAKRAEQYRIVLPGEQVDPTGMVDAVVALAGPVDVVVLSGSLPPGAPAELYRAICDALPDTTTVVDTKGEPLARVVEGRADVVKPSRRELASLVEWTPADGDEIVLAARKVLDRGEVGALAISLGGDGAVLVQRSGEITWYEPPAVDVVSTVGSGDSMVAGITAGLVAGRPLVDAVADGVAAGAAAVLTPGTELCRPEDVERLRPQVAVR
ncbi:MAG: 1-phosphofructokinase family hexose kinase [Acidimicrobiia bacterium]